MTTELFWNTITPSMRSIWKRFCEGNIAKEFYLAGGTALALQLGHRHSVDLDFFSPTQSDISSLTEPLKLAFKGTTIQQVHNSWGNLILTVENVRVGFYSYGYKMVQPLLKDLLALAPKKYPDVRDFEIQVTKRMVYFERADQETDLDLIEEVEWETVKTWFEEQAEQIGTSWIE